MQNGSRPLTTGLDSKGWNHVVMLRFQLVKEREMAPVVVCFGGVKEKEKKDEKERKRKKIKKMTKL